MSSHENLAFRRHGIDKIQIKTTAVAGSLNVGSVHTSSEKVLCRRNTRSCFTTILVLLFLSWVLLVTDAATLSKTNQNILQHSISICSLTLQTLKCDRYIAFDAACPLQVGNMLWDKTIIVLISRLCCISFHSNWP